MNRRFLGDAFDHWKGSLISTLSGKFLIRNVVIEPMITDATQWIGEDVATYLRLVNREPPNSICHQDSTFSGVREEYFNKVPQRGDVFLDPDIGIATGAALREHVKVSELSKLLGNSERVLMVYQHSARGSFHKRLIKIKEKISDHIPNVHCVIYECGRVAMFFISLNKSRIQGIQNTLREYLRGTAETRIYGLDQTNTSSW